MAGSPMAEMTGARDPRAMSSTHLFPANTFAHGVASGDPTTDRVILWTRVTTDEERVPVTWVLARNEALTDVVGVGSATAHADRDHTVHVDAGGLEPDTTYHFRF